MIDRAMNPPAVLFDTNAVSYLFDCPWFSAAELEELRKRLRASTAARRRSVVMTGPLFEEIAPLRSTDPAKFAAMVTLLRYVSGGLVLKPFPDRVRLEFARGGRALNKDAFAVASWNRAASDLAFAQSTTKITEDRKRWLAQLDEETRTEIAMVSERDPTERAKTIRLYDQRRDAVVEDWCRSDMRDFFAPNGYPLSRHEERWPHPRSIPSLWFQRSFHIARLRAVMLDGRKIDGADVFDSMHFEDAAYAQELVTKDGRFMAIAKDTTGTGGLEVIAFDDWARKMLSDPLDS
jgi:hypothetical protein